MEIPAGLANGDYPVVATLGRFIALDNIDHDSAIKKATATVCGKAPDSGAPHCWNRRVIARRLLHIGTHESFFPAVTRDKIGANPKLPARREQTALKIRPVCLGDSDDRLRIVLAGAHYGHGSRLGAHARRSGGQKGHRRGGRWRFRGRYRRPGLRIIPQICRIESFFAAVARNKMESKFFEPPPPKQLGGYFETNFAARLHRLGNSVGASAYCHGRPEQCRCDNWRYALMSRSSGHGPRHELRHFSRSWFCGH